MLNWLLCQGIRFLLWLRYRVRVIGLREVAERGTSGILFLPNHPALIDPFIVIMALYPRFRPRSLADLDQTDRPVVRWLAKRGRVRRIPAISTHGRQALPEVRRALAECTAHLEQGDNLVLYPSGHASYQRLEDLGGNSAVHHILKGIPDLRVVLVRVRGLWGSGFSRASGRDPDVGKLLKKAIASLLLNGIFFSPRRRVTLELHEPGDLPRTGTRDEINRFLEAYYNDHASYNTYVPYTLWERGGVVRRPEPNRSQTRGDGRTAPAGPGKLKPIPAEWFAQSAENQRLPLPEGDTIPEAFLQQAGRTPGKLIVADQLSGAKTYRDLVTAVLALKPQLPKLPGNCLGIMLPSGVMADTVYLAALFAGKTPVMVNWTVGQRNVLHSLDLVGVRKVLTAKTLVARLKARGRDLSGLAARFVFLEEIGARTSLVGKLGAWLKSRLTWASLRSARVSETAVILFTSGSEALPKAVPLTHRNILSNLRDLLQALALLGNDRLVGMLPPFHSFGLTANVALALCGGLPVVHHPNPTQGATLARLTAAYQATVLIGTPTFLACIARGGTAEQLATVRLIVTGAEKCPERVYAALADRCPNAKVLEGYGVTETSPVISVNDENDPRPGTIGKILASFEHALLDPDTGQRVTGDAPGVLLVRGPSVFGGYLHYDGEPPFVDLGGKQWYSTGDIVSEDADGVLTFRGRLKRFVKQGGEMISLPAIESVLASHYQADDAEGPTLAVEATPREDRPEIVLFTTRPLDRMEVNHTLRDAGFSPLHNIRRVIQVEQIPLLATGKTDYRALKAFLAQSAPNP